MIVVVIKLPHDEFLNDFVETVHQMFVTDDCGGGDGGSAAGRLKTVGAVSYNVTLLDVPRDRHFVQASRAVDKQTRVGESENER